MTRLLPRSLARLALLCASGLLGAAPALAADTPGAGPCRDDIRRHCAGVTPGGGRALDCLQAHEPELSGACRAALPTLRQCSQEIRAACAEATRPRALRACLRDKADTLSPQCRRPAASR